MKYKTSKIKVIDLFCGIGGLTNGLIKEGLDVVAGIDNDKTCKFGYEYNNKTQFIDSDILKVTKEDINKLFGKENEIKRSTGYVYTLNDFDFKVIEELGVSKYNFSKNEFYLKKKIIILMKI